MIDNISDTRKMREASMRRIFTVIFLLAGVQVAGAAGAACPDYLAQDVRKLRSSDEINLCEAFGGRPMLIVNTASHCGFTPQFEGLEALHRQYEGRGLAVIGVPSNDFRQAAKDEETAARICYINYGVTFTMLSQQKVTGPDAHPIFQALGREAGAPRWNFTKYLVDRNGIIVQRFDTMVEPTSPEVRKAIESVL